MHINNDKNQIMDVHDALILAVHHYSGSDFNDAETICRQILEKMPDHADALQILGCIAYQRGQLEKSLQLFSHCIEIIPENPIYLNNLGEVLIGTGDIDRAINLFKKAVEIKPDYAEPFHNLGKCYQAMGLLEKAEQYQQKALEIKYDFFNAHISLSSVTLPGENYMALLKRFHEWLRPSAYIEIGVETGKSLALAQPPTIAIGIEPEPELNHEFTAPTKLFKMTSDDFFCTQNLLKETNNQKIDLAFIDGLHFFEQTLRDFINIERFVQRDSIILIHDCLPLDEVTSSRNRTTKFWSGDPWKMIVCLKAYRPDLNVFTVATPPTGLGVITNPDPSSISLNDNYNRLLSEYIPLDYKYLNGNKNELLNVIPNEWNIILKYLGQ